MEILEPYGDPTSCVVIVGEDQRWIGVPFVEPFRGTAGPVLHKALREAGFRDDDLLFINAVACARSDLLGRPTIKDMLVCRDRLIREVEAHPRAVIVTLGATAFRALMGQPSLEVTGRPGQVFETPWGPLVLTLEALALTRTSQQPALLADLKHAYEIALLTLAGRALARYLAGDAEAGLVSHRGSVESRFWAKVRKTDNCWYWLGWRDSWGYGRFDIAGKKVRAHRFAYELLVGPIPAEWTIDHLCHHPACVNPSHLEAVTVADHNRLHPVPYERLEFIGR
jgi:uracil-DNA glycosylase family 4